MTKTLRLSYWDSCVFLSYLENHPERVPVIEAMLDDAKEYQRDQKIITSTLSIAEVCYVDGSEEDEEVIDQLWNNIAIIEIIEFHEGIARLARSIVRAVRALPAPHTEQAWKISGPDAVHLATAQLFSVHTFFTYDKKLLRLDGRGIVPFSIVKPFTPRPRLPMM
jgi:predicted nucleic acid-binding protein